MKDIPLDSKIEHDRLIYEMEPIARRLFEILKELPRYEPGSREVIEYKDFIVEIKPVERL